MSRIVWIAAVTFFFLSFCSQRGDNQKGQKSSEKYPVPEISTKHEEAVSLLGKSLYSPEPSEDAMEKYISAKEKYEKNPDSIDSLIWYGRRTAYLGRYREAISIFTNGISRFPSDARLYRHRGHRYITLRKFNSAVDDLEKASALITGKEDEVEPDGLPNARNTPVSSLHTNIWYHLALAYYLQNDLENALRTQGMGIEASMNDDMLTAFLHWHYMTLRRLGREKKALEALNSIHQGMDVIENMAYLNLCLFYKGEMKREELLNSKYSSIMNDAAAYGVGNWYLYNGEREKAREIYKKLLSGAGWPSFGYIAAEADYAREFVK